ncbi:MAG: glycoside hydrolase family 3 protein [Candidatus Melainabacteria bacterium]|nr:glycoside hydrolase family 3 protein [Candidatus Melainabacteria bacterium]
MACLYCYHFLVENNLFKKLGQLFFVGFEGYFLSKETRLFLKKIQPGGVIFFECNIKDKRQVKNLINEIKECLEIKPFIAIDQEGGSVERLRKICTSVPSPWGLAKLGLKELLTAQKIIAEELLELGFNMNLGPILDINSNFANPIIGSRSISANPKIVSEYGSQIINLYLKHNIIPVAKHFPGHGDLNTDSHLSLPVLSKTKTELSNFELIPFKKAIQNKVPVIMVGHIQLPEIEKEKKSPASLSKNVLQGLLRNTLGFKGLIITDELNMKGVTKNYTLSMASYKAIKSGADMVLFNFQEKPTLKAFEYVKRICSKNKKLLTRVEESYKRILSIKNRFSHAKSRNTQPRSTTVNKKIASNLANKVVHWIKKDLFFLPVRKNEPIEIIYPVTQKLRNEDLERILKELKIKKYNLINYKLNPDFESIKNVLNKVKTKKKKILITYNVASKKMQKNLINLLLDKYSDLIVISAGLEHDLEIVPRIKNFISAYSPNYVSLLAAFNKLLS